MNFRALSLPALALFLTGCAQHIAPAPVPVAALAPSDLRSPWDNTPVAAAADVPYNCGPAAPVGPDILITKGIDSEKKGLSEDVKNAVYSVSSRALKDLAGRVVSAADVYRATGNLQAAKCTAMLLTDAATKMTMTGDITTTEGWNEHNYALRSFSIAYLKVRPSGQIPQEYAKVITLWMDGLARRERSYIESFRCYDHKCPVHDHAGMNIAIATATVGIAANDYDLFHWSTAQYKTVVGQIDDRGMLHHDNRGRWAEKWNLESCAALVQIAELAETNNIPLYGYDDGRIHFLVHTVALGLIDATPYKQATHTSQKTENPIPAWEVVWASVYNRRFPDPILTGLLHQVGPTPVDMWGGAPWAPEEES